MGSTKRWGRKEGDQRQKSGGNNAVWRTGLSKEKTFKGCLYVDIEKLEEDLGLIEE